MFTLISKQKRALVDLYVIRGNAPALFGREWINVFIPVDKWLSDVNVTSQNLLSSNESNSVVHHSSPDSQSNFVSDNSKNSKSNSVSSRSKVTSDKCFSLLKEKFPEVFQEGIGVLKGIEAHLFLQDGASPVFCKSRNIPYALQKGVRDELDRLERARSNNSASIRQTYNYVLQDYSMLIHSLKKCRGTFTCCLTGRKFTSCLMPLTQLLETFRSLKFVPPTAHLSCP